jgi:hypothetical protein
VSAWHRSIGDDGRVSFYVEAPNGDWGYGAVSPDETFWEWEFDGQYDSVVDAGTGDITTAVTIEVFPDRAVFFFGVSKEASFGGRVFPPDSQVWLTCAPPATHDRMGTWGNSISIDYNNIIDPRVGGISLFEIQAFESTGFWRSLKNTTEV